MDAVFDANVMLEIGADRRQPDPAPLLALMDKYGIAQALVFYEAAREGEARESNRALCVAIRDQPRLVPCWVLDPCVLHPSPADIVREAEHLGVRAMRWFVRRYDVPLADPLIDRWMTRLERAGISLLIDWESASWREPCVDWPVLLELARTHPKLPIILIGRSLGDTLHLYTAWDRVHNLYAETSAYQTAGGLADASKRYGPARFLFGSGLPHNEPACPLAMLSLADLPTGTRQAIAGQTLRKLLAIERPAAEITSRVPLTLPYRVIDVHGHLDMPREVYSAAPTADAMIEQMDRTGIECVYASSLSALQEDDPVDGHDRLAEGMNAYPGRIRGYAAFNPAYFDPVGELDRCLDGFQMQGISIHCDFAQRPFSDAVWRHAFDAAAQRRLPLLAHGEATLDYVRQVCREFSPMTLILAQVGGMSAEDAYNTLELAEELPNLYLETSGAMVRRGALEQLVKAWGPEKLLFGSDMCSMDASYQLGRVLGADIAEGAKRMILRDNALAVFRESVG